MSLQTRSFLLVCFYLSLVPSMAKANNVSHNQVVSNFHVGVVLDVESAIGKVAWNCIETALSDFYAVHLDYKTRLSLHLRDSKDDNVQASLAVLDLLQNVKVQAIIGPQKSSEADLVIEFGEKAHVPIISFSATRPSCSFETPYFFQAMQNVSSQMQAIAAIIKDFKWREVVTIHEIPNYSNGFIPHLTEVLQEYQVRVSYKSGISHLATDDQIRLELYKLMNMHNRVFIVHMSHTLGSRFFSVAKEMGMMSNEYVWIITDQLMNLLDLMDTTIISSMQGVLGVKPYIRSTVAFRNFTGRYKSKFQHGLNMYGIWAYDVIWALAMAAEMVGATESLPERAVNNLTDITVIKTSKTGVELVRVISKTRFEGLSGDFHFVNGQLESNIFQVFNLIGKEGREVGFWTPGHGLSKELNLKNDQMYANTMINLRTIIWPGDSIVIPKGWVTPMRGKRLRVGVPVKRGFDEFVRVERDVQSNKTTIGGYSIDVFNLVMEALAYPVAYEFEPFMNANGSSAGSHFEMIYEVYRQRYDAVVGDTTITANRSFYVDFTLPYAEGGISMMVPLRHNNRKSAWIFLEPLTKDLWLTSGAFFIFTGFVVWIREHPINKDFRGPLSQHVGMIFWFPLSTLVFAHRERIVGNLTRFVIVIWIFVVLILNSSYTASLSSILTVERLQPSVTGVEELKKNGDFVGHQKGSFVRDFLKEMDFHESKIKPYSSHEEMHEALQKGSQNGGISAFFSTVPYIKVFIAKYCNKYTMIGPVRKTEGFGFVFPRGSPLVDDVSRAILEVSDSIKMKELDRGLFDLQTICSDPDQSLISNSLDLNSFRVLFIITGTVSGFALLLYLVIFLFKNRQVVARGDSSEAIWPKIKTMLQQFDKRKDFLSRSERARSMEVRDIEAPQSCSSESTFSDGNHSPIEGIFSVHINDLILNSIELEELDDVGLSD